MAGSRDAARTAGAMPGRPRRRPPRAPGAAAGSRRPGAAPVMFFGAAALLVVGLVAAVVVVGLDGGERSAPRSTVGRPDEDGVVPSTYSSAPSTAAFGAIDRRTADAAPLTGEEVFPARSRSLAGPAGKGKLTLRDQRLDADCAEAVWGVTVGEALREGGCTQAARGAYSGGGHGMTVAIFNMAGAEDANRLVTVLGQSGGGGFVKPLGDFGQGFSMARGLAMGHYAVVGWVQRLDGKGDAQDEALLSLLVQSGDSKAVLARAVRPR